MALIWRNVERAFEPTRLTGELRRVRSAVRRLHPGEQRYISITKICHESGGSHQLPREGSLALMRRIRSRLRLVGHSGPVTSVALSPDGRSLLSGSRDGTMRLWRVETLEDLTAWVRANRDVPLLPCGVNSDYNLTDPVECVDASPTASAQ